MFLRYVISVVGMALLAFTSSAQTVIRNDTLRIRGEQGQASIVPSPEDSVVLNLPSRSGVIALESDGLTSPAYTGSAIAYVADTVVTGGEWETILEIEVDSGKGGVLEYYFEVGGTNPVTLYPYRTATLGAPTLISAFHTPLYINNVSRYPYGQVSVSGLCYLGGAGGAGKCREFTNLGTQCAPFRFELEVTASGNLLEQTPSHLLRQGMYAFEFADNAQTANNIDMQDNYYLATVSPNFPNNWSQLFSKAFTFLPTSSGVVRLKVQNFRGQVATGNPPAANQCCQQVLVNVESNARIFNARLILH